VRVGSNRVKYKVSDKLRVAFVMEKTDPVDLVEPIHVQLTHKA
jgi:hypothetical protein